MTAKVPPDDPLGDTLAAPQACAETVTSPSEAAGGPAAGRLHDAEAQTLPGPAVPSSAPSPSALLPLLTDDERYDIAGEVARGGLGRILAAKDRRLRRQVALKELLDDRGDAEARFLREALITARLQHPSIIPLHDAGRFRDGKIFYSMKLVSGRSLEAAIEARPTLAERLSLLPHVIDVAEAIAYAHSQRIIHRDLKPQNVLVGEFGETVVIDWGIAKDLSVDDADSGRAAAPAELGEAAAQLTMDGAVVGTPAYMPPEQARGAKVDERADVYALGGILYHLLAGAPPYDDLGIRQILFKLLSKPPKPPAPLRDKAQGVPRELDAIVEKAMAGAVEDRYRSAGDLVADLKKFQTGQIVGAYRYSTRELLARFLRRNRAAVALAAVLAGAAAVSVAQVVDKGRVAERGRLIAEEAREKAARAEERERARADEITLAQARLSLDHDPEKSLRFLTQLSPAFARTSTVRVIAADALSRPLPRALRGHQGGVHTLAVSPDGRLLASGGNDGVVQLWSVETGQGRPLTGHTGLVIRLAFSPDGRRLASASYDRTVRLWDVAAGQSAVLAGHGDWLSTVVFSPDGKRLASGSADTELRLWDLTADPPRLSSTLKGHQDHLNCTVFSPDGAELVSASNDGMVQVWNTATGRGRVLLPREVDGVVVAASADGATMAMGHSSGELRLIATRTGQSRLLHASSPPFKMAFAPDGKRLAAAGSDRTVQVWDVAEGKLALTLRGHEKPVRALSFSPDGGTLATGGADSTVRLWTLASGEHRTLRAHEGSISTLLFTPDGAQLASASWDATVRLWRLSSDEGPMPGHTGPVSFVLFSPDGARAFSASQDGTIRAWDVATRRSEVLDGHGGAVYRLALSPDGRLLAAGGADPRVQVWDLDARPPRPAAVLETAGGSLRDLAFSPDGRLLASSTEDALVRLWDMTAPDKSRPRILGEKGAGGGPLTFSPDGRRLGTVGLDKIVRVWTPSTGEVRSLKGHASMILGLTFSPDSRLVASASLDGTVLLWDPLTEAPRVFRAEAGGLYTVRFSPRGDQIAASSDTGVIRLWDLATGEGKSLLGHTARVRHVAYSPDGRTLASVSGDGELRLWDLASHESRALKGHTDEIWRVAFSPDGRRLVTAGSDNTVGLWRDALPHDRDALLAHLRGVLREAGGNAP